MRTIFALLLLTVLAPNFANAYIPPYWMILSRVADNHGKGPYQIDQTVEFNHTGETLAVRERWFIDDEDSLRLEATGLGPLSDKLRLTFVYSGGRRHYVDQNGVKKFAKAPDDFFEPYLHFRKSKPIKAKLVSQKIVPPVTLKSEAHRYSERNPIPHEENFVRLSRVGGAITYAIGEPSPIDEKVALPGLWIEQDQFHIRKIRFPSGTEFKANGFQKQARDAWMPSEILASWSGSQSAKIVINKVTGLTNNKTIKDLFDSSSLNFGKDPQVSTVLPEDQVINSFYQKLR